MKLATFSVGGGKPAIGVVDTDSGTIVDLQAGNRAITGKDDPVLADMVALIEGGEAALATARRVATEAADSPGCRHALDSVTLLAPIPLPPQIRDFSGYGQHMRDASHGAMRLKARIDGTEPPPDVPVAERTVAEVYKRQPIYYLTNRFSVVGPDVDVTWPAYSEYLDYELEIAAVIGPGGHDIPREKARDHIFGYTIFNDFSARDRQVREMEGRMGPAKGKSFDTGNTVGPWIVTADEIGDPYALAVSVKVNGETWAENTTADIMHTFEDMIAFVSQDETLYAGEIFGSGTVGGCSGMETDQWIKDGDLVELTIERIGVLANRVVKK